MSPDSVIFLGTILISLGTFVYHKVKGDKTNTLADLASGLVDQGIHLAVVKVDSDPSAITTFVSKYVWEGLGKLGVQSSGTVGMLVTAAIAQGVGAALAEARDHDRALQAQIAANIAAAQAALAKQVPALAPVAPGLIQYTEHADDASYKAAVAKDEADVAAHVAAAAAAGKAPL